MVNNPLVITEKLAQVELLGHDADIIAQSIHNVIEIVGEEWGKIDALPGALVPVILDAADRAVLKKLVHLQSLAVSGTIISPAYLHEQIEKITNRIAEREEKKSMEEAA
jgi:hypothetical protein